MSNLPRGIKLPPIERPNGKIYRPRTIQPVALGFEDEITDIIVFGTHDVRYAEIIAQPELERISGEFFYDDPLAISGPGRKVWRRRDLAAWGGDYDGPQYVYAESPEHGRAGVMFPVEPTERAAE